MKLNDNERSLVKEIRVRFQEIGFPTNVGGYLPLPCGAIGRFLFRGKWIVVVRSKETGKATHAVVQP